MQQQIAGNGKISREKRHLINLLQDDLYV